MLEKTPRKMSCPNSCKVMIYLLIILCPILSVAVSADEPGWGPLGLPVINPVQTEGEDARASEFQRIALPNLEPLIQLNLSQPFTVEGLQALPLDSSRLTLTTSWNLRVYLIGEEAGYHNTLGGNFSGRGVLSGEPFIVFPDVSVPDILRPGNFVDCGQVSAGTSLDFFIISDGAQVWGGGGPVPLRYSVYSTDISSNMDGMSHVLAFAVKGTPYMVVGFEDVFRGGDRDFTDILVAVEIGEENINALLDVQPTPTPTPVTYDPDSRNINTSDYFPDEHLRVSMEEILGVESEQPFSREHAASITSFVDFRSKRFGDSTGIEFLSAVTGLDISGSFFTSLDLSHNTRLRYLDCSNNPYLENLTLPNNSDLVWLDCSNSPTGHLKNLDISHCPNLRWLRCSHQQLSRIDVSNNPNLIWLDCSYNQIEEIKLSNNPALVWFNSSGNQLADVSSLVACKGLGKADMVDIRDNWLTADDWNDVSKLRLRIGEENFTAGGIPYGVFFSPQIGIDPYEFVPVIHWRKCFH